MILEVNDSATVERVRPLFFKRLAMAIERWTYRNADGLVFVSSVFRDRAIAAHTGIAPAIVTPNAANIDKFTFTQAQRDERKRKLRMYLGSAGALVGVFLVLLIIEFIQRGSVV